MRVWDKALLDMSDLDIYIWDRSMGDKGFYVSSSWDMIVWNGYLRDEWLKYECIIYKLVRYEFVRYEYVRYKFFSQKLVI